MKTLLLNSTYECISFPNEYNVFKLLSKGKAEIMSSWDDEKVQFGKDNVIKYPAVIKMVYRVPFFPKRAKFSRPGVFKRDRLQCQYCGEQLTYSKATWDHIRPRKKGGENSWLNCVTSCNPCNNWKGEKTLEEAGMKLLRRPSIPALTIADEYYMLNRKHPSWGDYIIY